MTIRLIPDYPTIARRWWEVLGPEWKAPFTPDANADSNDGIVRSASGAIIVDCAGDEGKADVIAASLNYMAVVKEKTPFTLAVDEDHYKMGLNDARNGILTLLRGIKDGKDKIWQAPGSGEEPANAEIISEFLTELINKIRD